MDYFWLRFYILFNLLGVTPPPLPGHSTSLRYRYDVRYRYGVFSMLGGFPKLVGDVLEVSLPLVVQRIRVLQLQLQLCDLVQDLLQLRAKSNHQPVT